MSRLPPPKIEPGKRAVVAGRTGSGKSTLAEWLLIQSPGHWLIINPKATAAYDKLPDSKKIEGIDLAKITKSMQENRFTIVNPTRQQNNFETLDALIVWLHDGWLNVGLCVDELYAIHQNGRPGEGLIAWLTRGRELKQSFLGLTQRPAWVSKFLMSEADYIGVMALNLKEDRKRMYEITGQELFEISPEPFYWHWYNVSKDSVRSFGPVPHK